MPFNIQEFIEVCDTSYNTSHFEADAKRRSVPRAFIQISGNNTRATTNREEASSTRTIASKANEVASQLDLPQLTILWRTVRDLSQETTKKINIWENDHPKLTPVRNAWYAFLSLFGFDKPETALKKTLTHLDKAKADKEIFHKLQSINIEMREGLITFLRTHPEIKKIYDELLEKFRLHDDQHLPSLSAATTTEEINHHRLLVQEAISAVGGFFDNIPHTGVSEEMDKEWYSTIQTNFPVTQEENRKGETMFRKADTFINQHST